MKKIGMQEFQEESEVEAFNLIGQDAETKGYDVVYFKALMPRFEMVDGEFKILHNYMQYIHLMKDEELKYSIFFDEFELGSICMSGAYYELYDRCDIERFGVSEESELFKRVRELI